ncbi:Endonuclease/Exonuclease/phosphatase family protein [Symmachiella dynata]|uniref:Endonuclease/Exonuclease/phosphatase family protein n=1 Tax=Symmachiella dynata TaxID=2527995 RepID=A0A517ZPA7_9PLAN|nr:endonuclease/exonuclease/phosphatase family protein [Symmachiella dynata]QDU44313.1 Endonuclease/Exonuclease/phosphatase family protein [Symmachiella dynata]
MKRQFLSAVVVLAVSFPCSLSAADFFRIGTFNIERLGSRSPGQQPIAIAEHIDLSGADVIGLQEIDVTTTVTDDTSTPYDDSRRNDALDTAFAILSQEDDVDWKYELFPNRDPNDSTQLCGVAWNAKQIIRDGAAFPIPITGSNANRIWDRRPHAVKLSYAPGKTDVVFIPVHMKSNFGSAAQGRATRKKEANALVSQLAAVSAHFGDDKDIIVGGDTNILAADEDAAEIFGNAGYRDTNSLDATTFIGSGRGAPFDRFFLSDEPEFVFARQYILQATEPVAHDEYLSDHQMALISFRVKADDD